MSINDFIEYAKVIRKYRPVLEEYKYYIDFESDLLSLYNNWDSIEIAEKDEINLTPAELDKYIKKTLLEDKKDEITQKMEKLEKEQKRLEILLKTIDNAN